jgi:hypothetical protein
MTLVMCEAMFHLHSGQTEQQAMQEEHLLSM